MSVGEEEVEIEGSVGVKQGDNLVPILFIYLIQAVATTMDKKWTFATPDFRRHGSKKDGQVKYNPSLGKKVSIKTAGEKFSFWKSFYVDDAAFLFLSRKDIEEGAKLIQPHFARFGLTVHCGDKRTGADSKTEAMFIPAAGKKATDADTADIYLNDHEFFGYCNKFKYLGTIFTPSLKDDADINKRITSAVGAFATMKKVLCNSRIPVKLRVRIFDATCSQYPLMGLRKLGTHSRTRKETQSLPQQISKENGRNYDIRCEGPSYLYGSSSRGTWKLLRDQTINGIKKS